MVRKLIETASVVLLMTLAAFLVVIGLQSEEAERGMKAVRDPFFEDLDDIAPGPVGPEATGDGPAQWILSDDYPMEAIRNEWQGTSAIEWTIDRRGRAVDCRVTVSSGHAVLDRAACNAITSRARYRPARNESGHRIEVREHRRVVWRLPD